MAVGDGVVNTRHGWCGVDRGPCVLHPFRTLVERSPSWVECVPPEDLEVIDPQFCDLPRPCGHRRTG
jgi:hypothetical protein